MFNSADEEHKASTELMIRKERSGLTYIVCKKKSLHQKWKIHGWSLAKKGKEKE